MDASLIIELIGYWGSILVVVSMLMSVDGIDERKRGILVPLAHAFK